MPEEARPAPGTVGGPRGREARVRGFSRWLTPCLPAGAWGLQQHGPLRGERPHPHHPGRLHRLLREQCPLRPGPGPGQPAGPGLPQVSGGTQLPPARVPGVGAAGPSWAPWASVAPPSQGLLPHPGALGAIHGHADAWPPGHPSPRFNGGRGRGGRCISRDSVLVRHGSAADHTDHSLQAHAGPTDLDVAMFHRDAGGGGGPGGEEGDTSLPASPLFCPKLGAAAAAASSPGHHPSGHPAPSPVLLTRPSPLLLRPSPSPRPQVPSPFLPAGATPGLPKSLLSPRQRWASHL